MCSPGMEFIHCSTPGKLGRIADVAKYSMPHGLITHFWWVCRRFRPLSHTVYVEREYKETLLIIKRIVLPRRQSSLKCNSSAAADIVIRITSSHPCSRDLTEPHG